MSLAMPNVAPPKSQRANSTTVTPSKDTIILSSSDDQEVTKPPNFERRTQEIRKLKNALQSEEKQRKHWEQRAIMAESALAAAMVKLESAAAVVSMLKETVNHPLP